MSDVISIFAQATEYLKVCDKTYSKIRTNDLKGRQFLENSKG